LISIGRINNTDPQIQPGKGTRTSQVTISLINSLKPSKYLNISDPTSDRPATITTFHVGYRRARGKSTFATTQTPVTLRFDAGYSPWTHQPAQTLQ